MQLLQHQFILDFTMAAVAPGNQPPGPPPLETRCAICGVWVPEHLLRQHYQVHAMDESQDGRMWFRVMAPMGPFPTRMGGVLEAQNAFGERGLVYVVLERYPQSRTVFVNVHTYDQAMEDVLIRLDWRTRVGEGWYWHRKPGMSRTFLEGNHRTFDSAVLRMMAGDGPLELHARVCQRRCPTNYYYIDPQYGDDTDDDPEFDLG